LAEAKEFVVKVHDRLADASTEASPEERFGQAAPLILRAAGMLGTLEPRLQQFTDNIAGALSRLQSLNERTQSWILVVTIGVTLLILLMAAGQIALCRLAWIGGEKTQGG
jgi:hypothetical protein